MVAGDADIEAHILRASVLRLGTRWKGSQGSKSVDGNAKSDSQRAVQKASNDSIGGVGVGVGVGTVGKHCFRVFQGNHHSLVSKWSEMDFVQPQYVKTSL